MTSPGVDRGANGGSDRLQGAPFLHEVAEWHRQSTGPAGAGTRGAVGARHAAALVLWGAGRVREAFAALLDVAAECLRTLGPDDPDTLIAQGNLAVLHADLGRGEEALTLLTTNLADRTRVFGARHPATLTAGDALAAAHRLGGSVARAVDLSARVTAERAQVLGASHRDTLVSRLGHALARLEDGDVPTALQQLTALLQSAERVLGPADPLSVVVHGQLTYCGAGATGDR